MNGWLTETHMSEKTYTLMDEWIDWWSGNGSDRRMVELIKKSKYPGFALFYHINTVSPSPLMCCRNIIHRSEYFIIRL